MTYPVAFRRKVLATKMKEKLSFAKVAKRFDVAVNSVFLWSKSLEAKKTRNKAPTKINMEVLQDDIRFYPDAYQYERAKRLGVSRGCIAHALKRLKVSYKKKPSTSQGGCRKKVYVLPDAAKA